MPALFLLFVVFCVIQRIATNAKNKTVSRGKFTLICLDSDKQLMKVKERHAIFQDRNQVRAELLFSSCLLHVGCEAVHVLYFA